jgi:hypothetical protein
MQREIRRILEKALPADCLEYLNDQFREKEQMIQKVKEYEKKVDWLLDEMAKKDAMLWQLFSKTASSLQSMGSYGVDSEYSMIEPFGYKRYNPTYPSFEAEMRRSRGNRNEMRRGVPRSFIESERGTRNEEGETNPDIRMPQHNPTQDPFINPPNEVY